MAFVLFPHVLRCFLLLGLFLFSSCFYLMEMQKVKKSYPVYDVSIRTPSCTSQSSVALKVNRFTLCVSIPFFDMMLTSALNYAPR